MELNFFDHLFIYISFYHTGSILRVWMDLNSDLHTRMQKNKILCIYFVFYIDFPWKCFVCAHILWACIFAFLLNIHVRIGLLPPPPNIFFRKYTEINKGEIYALLTLPSPSNARISRILEFGCYLIRNLALKEHNEQYAISSLNSNLSLLGIVPIGFCCFDDENCIDPQNIRHLEAGEGLQWTLRAWFSFSIHGRSGNFP